MGFGGHTNTYTRNTYAKQWTPNDTVHTFTVLFVGFYLFYSVFFFVFSLSHAFVSNVKAPCKKRISDNWSEFFILHNLENRFVAGFSRFLFCFLVSIVGTKLAIPPERSIAKCCCSYVRANVFVVTIVFLLLVLLSFSLIILLLGTFWSKTPFISGIWNIERNTRPSRLIVWRRTFTAWIPLNQVNISYKRLLKHKERSVARYVGDKCTQYTRNQLVNEKEKARKQDRDRMYGKGAGQRCRESDRLIQKKAHITKANSFIPLKLNVLSLWSLFLPNHIFIPSFTHPIH